MTIGKPVANVLATQTKCVEAGTGVTVRELKGHWELTAAYCRETLLMALEAQRNQPSTPFSPPFLTQRPTSQREP